MTAERRDPKGTLALVLASCLVAIASCGSESPAPPERSTPNVTRNVLDTLPKVEKPNVLLILIDTLRRDHLGSYGYARDTSPNIDALASTGIRYDRAYSQASWTTPSTAAILSGLHPTELGIKRQPNPLSDGFLLLPEILRAHGYVTGGIVSHMYIAERWNFDQGYDFFDERNALGHDAVTSESVSDLAIDFIDRRFTQGPSFLFAHYFDPHFLYIEQDGHAFSEDPDYDGWITSGLNMLLLMRDAAKVEPRDLDKLLSLYDSEIAYTDEQIGRVLDHLRARDLFDDTLIILTADHGEEFLDHGAFNHAMTLYEEQIHVPLIVKWPRAKAGAVSDRTVQTMDIFPTILEYLDIEIEHPISARSLQSRSAERPAYSETSRTGVDLRAMIDGDDKIIWNLAPKPGEPAVRHYRLDSDPSESAPREPTPGSRATELQRRLEEHFGALERRASGGARDLILSEEERKRLEALGYTE